MPIFTVNSGKIRISDPCYDKDDVFGGMVISAKNGDWVGTADMEQTGWGERVVRLTAEHRDHSKFSESVRQRIMVDSGQVGVFDLESYKDDSLVRNVKRIHKETICEDEPWYSICCDRTLSEYQWGVIPNGVVSTSGYGDGVYEATCFVDKNGDAFRVEVIFIDDEGDEEDEEDE